MWMTCVVVVVLFQTPAAPTRSDTPLQSELLPELSDSSQTPSTDHVVPPPSTVDTAALSEEPLPGEGARGAGLTDWLDLLLSTVQVETGITTFRINNNIMRVIVLYL